MKNINITKRRLTTLETARVNDGFDKLSLDEGVLLESHENLSFIAQDMGKMQGCSVGKIHKNGEQFSGWFHLSDLFVEKEYRNQGIGSLLLQKTEQYLMAKGVNKVRLWTSGASSLRFYKRHGYQAFTEMKLWYSDGSSRFGLVKHLPATK